MDVPTKAIGSSNECDETYEAVSKYLNRAMEIGDSGKWSEERAMLLKLIEVDSFQPCAYNNLSCCCVELAQRSAKRPNQYEELAMEAFHYLTIGLDIALSEKLAQIDNSPEPSNTKEEIYKMFISTIHMKAVPFMDDCMKGVRGAGNIMLEKIEDCLSKCSTFLEKRSEPFYDVEMTLGFCLQKLKRVGSIAFMA